MYGANDIFNAWKDFMRTSTRQSFWKQRLVLFELFVTNLLLFEHQQKTAR